MRQLDTGRRRFLTWSTVAVGGVGAAFTAVPFIKSWNPSAKAKAAGARLKWISASWSRVKIPRRVAWQTGLGGEAHQADAGCSGCNTMTSCGILRQTSHSNRTMPTMATDPSNRNLRGRWHLHSSGMLPFPLPDSFGEQVQGNFGFFCPAMAPNSTWLVRCSERPTPLNLVIPPYQFRRLVGADGQEN